ncbi:hypothetical protein J2X04_001624 [Lysobacter niabensis]|uniref:Protein TolA n=1 Tax=Agrilutibacter niabensis TaxID=380628 RepID=A0ABU1VP70_9GAMM|nr:TonB C-terminal domain-containing protein [Lysobacter niabensis]MDR7099277.1 hypothetical protein [Lysobacter niabensis]
MKRTLALAASILLVVFCQSSFAQSPRESSEADGAVADERLRQLQQIRVLRAEARRKAEDAERRLAALSAKRGVRPDGTAISWPEAIITVINSNWIRPPIAETGTTGCTASIVIDRSGQVMSIDFKPACNSDPLKHSIENAIIKSSPLPVPDDSSQFTNKIVARFVPQDEA